MINTLDDYNNMMILNIYTNNYILQNTLIYDEFMTLDYDM